MAMTTPREDRPELLDDPNVSRTELERSLTDLETANRWLGGANTLLPHIAHGLSENTSFLDIGCGGGDILRTLSRMASHRGYDPRLTGLDVHQGVVEIARTRCRHYPQIEIVQGDALSLPFPDRSFDVVYSSTFIHHLSPDVAVQALREALRVARRRVVVVDLVRSRLGWLGVSTVGRLFFGRLSRYDGPVSFRRAYTPSELLDLANQAELPAPRVVAGLIRMALISDRGEE